MEVLSVPQGNFSIQRLPFRRNELLRGWDAADEYLLTYLAEQALPKQNSKILIVNDSFGALATALASHCPMSLTDSYLTQQATRINLHSNNLDSNSLQLLNSLQTPTAEVDLLLIKAPKTHALLEDILHRLRPQLKLSTTIIIAGMVKNLSTSVWNICERLLGNTTTSLAKKKARLIFVQFNPELRIPANPYPTVYTLENTQYRICNHANVFSRDQLDIGTRFFLQHLPTNFANKDIVDLGCGNGVVGVMAAVHNPGSRLHFVDESFMAVASAQQNYSAALGSSDNATFLVGDSLDSFSKQSMDLILCNPPFHQQQTIGDHIASKMFQQAKQTLRLNGELWVIGNRHLAYQNHLHKLFGNCQLIAGNPKFTILRAVR